MSELASAGIFGVLLIYTTVVTDAVNIEERKATLGETVVLPCTDAAPNRTSFITQWVKDGTIIPDSNSSFVQGSTIHFSILNNSSLQITGLNVSDGGNYFCNITPSTSTEENQTHIKLLIFGAPAKHPECLSQMGNVSMQLLLRCIWNGVYPLPTLHWTERSRSLGDREPVLNVSQTGESLEVKLNRSQLRDGQELRCTGHHPALEPKDYRSCSVTLKAPYPQGDPLVTAFAGKNVVLKCTETESIPPANTTWLKTIRQEKIIPSSKYIISQDGPVFTLTIVNCSKEEDEGVYFCRSENPISVQELEVYLTIKSSASNAGGVIGTFIAVLIVAAGIVVGVIAYSNRDRICLGHSFGNEERSDVLNLVDSDEEELFNDSATRITAVANGHATSLVQIHHNSPGDIEDLKSTDSERGEENTPTSEEGQATL